MLRKIGYAIGFIADYAFGSLLVIIGVGVIVGGATGSLALL